MTKDAAHEFLHILSELLWRIQNRSMGHHLTDRRLTERLHHEALIALVGLVEAIDKAEKVEKDARVSKDKEFWHPCGAEHPVCILFFIGNKLLA